MLSRRNVLKAGAAALSGAPVLVDVAAPADAAVVTRQGGEDYSHLSGAKRRAVPTTCGQCKARCPALGYVEQGRVVKLEGQPNSARTRGRLCARGQASINQVHDPDRIRRPMRRAGARGEGKWTEISWDDALAELCARLARMRDEARPERLQIHAGSISASARALIEAFLDAYGAGGAIGHGGQEQAAKRTALELTWGGYDETWDPEEARFVLNFGGNCLESGPNHIALANRLAASLAERRLRMVTVDVRLSNTAARSHQWVPIRPGTDLAMILAMCNVVMTDGLYRGAGETFLRFCRVTPNVDSPVAERIAALERHLAPYTPEWAEPVTGVSAGIIRALATEFAISAPACVISGRGAFAHYNGVETERAIQMLAAITGNIDRPGARRMAAVPRWVSPRPAQAEAATGTQRPIGGQSRIILPDGAGGRRVLRMIREGRARRPEMLIWYGCNPAYADAGVDETIEVLANEELVPYSVCVTPFYDETAALADLVLPDATHLEQWGWEEVASPDRLAEYAITQPLVAPAGEARQFGDVCCEIAAHLGVPLPVRSVEEFVRRSCEMTPEVKAAGGLDYMAAHGALSVPAAGDAIGDYRRELTAAELEAEGVILDEATGVYWNWKKTGASDEEDARRRGYAATRNACAGYVGQRVGGVVHAGFRPGELNKSGLFELYSAIAEKHGLGALPVYKPIPGHELMADGELVLTTYKVGIHSASKSQNCKWLSEVYHDNPAWINPRTAGSKGIRDGDRITVRSRSGTLETHARVTPLVAPGVIAVSAHCGHWEFGRFASGRRAPYAAKDNPGDEFKWWDRNGAHPNRIIPYAIEPKSGQQCWMDTVVTVIKA